MSLSSESKLILGVLGVVAPIIMSLALGGIYAILDARHEPAGAVLKADLRQVERDILDVQDLQRSAPSDLYSTSRENKLRRLKAERREIRDELGLSPVDEDG